MSFHIRMAIGWAFLMATSLVVLSALHITMAGNHQIATLGIICMMAAAPIPIYLHSIGRKYLCDSCLTLFWVVLAPYAAFFPIAAAARLGADFNLQDAAFLKIDALCGIDVPAISQWSKHTWIGHVINTTYNQLDLAMWIATILPLFFGKIERVHRLVSAFLVSVAISLPMIVLAPAIGPWYPVHQHGNLGQQAIEAEILTFRQPGPHTFIPTGIAAVHRFMSP